MKQSTQRTAIMRISKVQQGRARTELRNCGERRRESGVSVTKRHLDTLSIIQENVHLSFPVLGISHKSKYVVK